MSLRRLIIAAFASLAALTALPGVAAAQIEIDINQGVVQPLPVAIPAFTGTRGAEIAQVISANLERSGLFAPINPAAFPERNLAFNAFPQFDAWKGIGAQALINGQVIDSGDGRLAVQFHLWDVGGSSEIVSYQFSTNADSWRRLAHKVSDAVYEKLTGESGYFDTRIVYVAESGPRGSRIRRLSIMDQDGANNTYLTDGSYIVMTPRFSSTSQQITYMALRPTGSTIYLRDMSTGRQETLGRFPGMVFAPRFSPNGGAVVFSAERNGNTDLYLMNLQTRGQVRLTSDPGIDTSGSFSPNGGQIVFNSDRAGSAQLYVMNADGSGVRRISGGGGRYTTPVWSPKGDFIAFTKQSGGVFHIGVMRPDGSDERILTTSFLDEGPTWAPNGRVLMFFREGRGGNPELWNVDITGRILRKAPYQGSGSDPAWSPLLD